MIGQPYTFAMKGNPMRYRDMGSPYVLRETVYYLKTLLIKEKYPKVFVE